MTEYVDAWPVAKKRHRCGVCSRVILPGETYWRQAGLDGGSAWTNKTCAHCERVVWAHCRDIGDSDWYSDGLAEWLGEYDPAAYASMRAGWRWPDGELVPVPFGSRCFECGVRIEFRHLWCPPCDAARIARIDAGFRAVAAAFEEARA